MKRFLFSALFLSLMVVGAQAQSSACCKKGASKDASAKSCDGKSTSSTAEVSTTEAAAKLAATDKSIESKTCPVSGKVSYSKMETSKKGEVTYVDVNYDAETNTFVNASAMKMTDSKDCSSKSADAKACCAGKTADSKSKACCSDKSGSKSATSSTTTQESAKEAVKPVKG